MIGSSLSRLGCILVGHLYPLYKTFKCFKNCESTSEIEVEHLLDMRRILSFWAVNGIFMFSEYFLDFFIAWIPFYFESKILFLIWLVHGNFTGSQFVYDNFVEEVFHHHENDIDHGLAVSKAAFKTTASRWFAFLASQLANLFALAMQKSHETMMSRMKQGDASSSTESRFEEIGAGDEERVLSASKRTRSKKKIDH
ncbi:hypothetical protein GUITHDRAFT_138376 [Guillardia theta CCMP2712]|uniref:Receptor expression-enhancing protein n=2 Tax=Guillardia theta TaxID=55529 RepID=L1JCN0_GUITC|nr:hypothetical protein GUITHDRAFT_138376 [Guillardia theta CCMP2712]EKX46278.1 hypothetical protein GUITHDRAFT_138376 [Guillardia theta CCMP2712]|mmetsp:Transcript_27872/g.90597  ORF Transcript_27872/g.90597 Transcript_27872/m.90597 type:complete len:197 (+) Transcript_27872:47-637(+)|eukprot:XP_005833258.1 hypothetical protein GUITHDRAFT_138376 [Guillardia theta CCMP2712]